MAYRYGNNRNQRVLLPESMDEYIASDDPVRVYDAFVEALDLEKLGFNIDPHKVGNPEYSPHVMLKLLVYGYSYGIRSSRKLERACYHNLAFIWLTQGLKPDHKTIANFRKNNRTPLSEVLKQCARICIKLNLIEGNTLFLDGSKIRANASVKHSWDKKKTQRALKHIDEHIKEILTECDTEDELEEDQHSLVHMDSCLEDALTLRAKVEDILQELDEEKKKSLNTIDADATRINSPNGSHAGYTMQSVVDDKHGLILSTDVVAENNDLYQFAHQVTRANSILEKKCKVACADSGYATTSELAKIDQMGIKVIVPSQRQAADRKPSSFDKEHFIYDKLNDSYLCPEGNCLNFSHTDNKCKVYRISRKEICFNCPHYGTCTKSKQGRTIHLLLQEDIRKKLEAQYLKPHSQVIYKKRKEKVEHPFGHIKRNIGVTSFLLRGLAGVKAEASLLGTCFDLARMITILGLPVLLKTLKTL